MGCGCGGKPFVTDPNEKQPDGTPVLRGPANPNFTWPPRKVNGPKPKTA